MPVPTAPALRDAPSRAMALAITRMEAAVDSHVVALAARNGSVTPPSVRYIHFADATARAIGLPKSDAAVVAALPAEDRAILALIRQGVAARIPAWAAQVEQEGGARCHNRIRALAAEWAAAEALALRACGVRDVLARVEALALESHDVAA